MAKGSRMRVLKDSCVKRSSSRERRVGPQVMTPLSFLSNMHNVTINAQLGREMDKIAYPSSWEFEIEKFRAVEWELMSLSSLHVVIYTKARNILHICISVYVMLVWLDLETRESEWIKLFFIFFVCEFLGVSRCTENKEIESIFSLFFCERRLWQPGVSVWHNSWGCMRILVRWSKHNMKGESLLCLRGCVVVSFRQDTIFVRYASLYAFLRWHMVWWHLFGTCQICITTLCTIKWGKSDSGWRTSWTYDTNLLSLSLNQ